MTIATPGGLGRRPAPDARDERYPLHALLSAASPSPTPGRRWLREQREQRAKDADYQEATP